LRNPVLSISNSNSFLSTGHKVRRKKEKKRKEKKRKEKKRKERERERERKEGRKEGRKRKIYLVLCVFVCLCEFVNHMY
jgi:hypothetical protein